MGRGFYQRGGAKRPETKRATKLDKRNDLLAFLTMATDERLAATNADELARRYGVPPLEVALALTEQRDRRAARANPAG